MGTVESPDAHSMLRSTCKMSSIIVLHMHAVMCCLAAQTDRLQSQLQAREYCTCRKKVPLLMSCNSKSLNKTLMPS